MWTVGRRGGGGVRWGRAVRPTRAHIVESHQNNVDAAFIKIVV